MGLKMICYEERYSLLLKWFIASLWCIRKVGWTVNSIYKPPSCPCRAISAKADSQIAPKMTDCGVPSQHRKWDAVLQGKTAIAAEVFHDIPQMYMKGGIRFWEYQQVPYCSYGVIFAEIDSQISPKIPDLG